MKEEKEPSFFRKVITSIKDFERYPELASKGWNIVLPYLVKLLAVFTIIVSIASTYIVSKEFQSVITFIKEELPEFSFENNILSMENTPVVKENMDKLLDACIIDTNEQIAEENMQNYKEILQKSGSGILLLKDKMLIKSNTIEGLMEYSYSSISDKYQIQNFNKQNLIEYFSGTNLFIIYIAIFIMIFIYMLLIYIISIWLDIVLLGAFGYFTALIMRMHLRFSAMCKIAIHSLTLPILLNAVAVLLKTFTGFEIKYFEIMYIGVAYIYIIASILMIKSDFIKSQKELAKILEEQAKVRQEMERKKEEEERQKEEQKQENEKEKQRKKEKKEQKEEEQRKLGNNEPQGENA